MAIGNGCDRCSRPSYRSSELWLRSSRSLWNGIMCTKQSAKAALHEGRWASSAGPADNTNKMTNGRTGARAKIMIPQFLAFFISFP